jgi:hypothetical protein
MTGEFQGLTLDILVVIIEYANNLNRDSVKYENSMKLLEL